MADGSKAGATGVALAAVLVALSATGALAQVPAPSPAWPPPGRSDPTRMPGDVTPPPVAETLRPFSSKPAEERRLPPPDATPAIPMDVALHGAQIIVAACAAQGFAVAAAITDSAGVLRVGLSADGASPPGRLFGGVPKAVAALRFREPTSAVRAELMADPSRVVEVEPDMLVLPGGLPVIVDGRTLGAIGVSGASADQDETCAQAGLDAILRELR